MIQPITRWCKRNRPGTSSLAFCEKPVPLGFSWGSDDFKYLFNSLNAGESCLRVPGVTVCWTRGTAFWPGHGKYTPAVRDWDLFPLNFSPSTLPVLGFLLKCQQWPETFYPPPAKAAAPLCQVLCLPLATSNGDTWVCLPFRILVPFSMAVERCDSEGPLWNLLNFDCPWHC